jgi:putative colanic acid biosynthesis glycosyltransferase
VPKVSIVTIVQDHAGGLSNTYESLATQLFEDWEMIIIVGKSRDSTLNVSHALQHLDKRVRVIAQSGIGIYTAMNQGIENSLGEYLWFMNAGDEFASNEVLSTAIGLISVSQVGLVIGGSQITKENFTKIYSFPPRNVSAFNFSFSRRGCCHQAMIFKSDIIRELGGYVTDYKLANDFELILRVIQRAGATRVPMVFATVEPGGVSELGILLVLEEKNHIRSAFFQRMSISLLSLMWTYAAISKYVFYRQFNKGI